VFWDDHATNSRWWSILRQRFRDYARDKERQNATRRPQHSRNSRYPSFPNHGARYHGRIYGRKNRTVQFFALFSTVALGLLIILWSNQKNPYRILDYHSIHPDVLSDADSIPPPLPPIIAAEFDIQTTPGAASGALASLTENEPTSPRSYAEEMQQLTDACSAFLVQIQRGAAPWVVQRLNYIYGPMPTDPTHFSYWMAMVSIFFSFLSMFGHARMQARHVRPCAIADRDKPTGPPDRRYGKGQTFTDEIAAASSSASSALDRATEQSLVRRRTCHGIRIRMRIDPDDSP
jgi:hypothetical protein